MLGCVIRLMDVGEAETIIDMTAMGFGWAVGCREWADGIQMRERQKRSGSRRGSLGMVVVLLFLLAEFGAMAGCGGWMDGVGR